jgi:hypothetical protein
MAANNRVFYAVQGVRLRGPSGIDIGTIQNTGWDRVRGLQTVGINTNFNLEPIYQMGQLELYDNYEEVPDVEVTLNKVFDGFPLIYTMTMGSGALVEIANNRCGVQFGIFRDTDSAATGYPQTLLEIEPAYVSSATYTFSTEGNFTEDVTIVANDKTWKSPDDWGIYDAHDSNAAWTPSPTGFGINRRQHMKLEACVFPTGGIQSDDYRKGGFAPNSKINSVTITANLNREEIRTLGQRTPFLRYINFPVEITAEFEITSASGDMVGLPADANAACSNPKALENQGIKIALCDGTTFDLGVKNKLTTVNMAGGDTGGGNATVTYSYTTYNDFLFTPGTGIIGGDQTPAGFFETNQEDFNFQDGNI